MLTPLSDHLFRIEGENKGRFPRAHAFYIQDEVCALIDTGCGISVLEAFKKKYPIDLVINSHCHPDHGAGNWLFPDQPLWVPEDGTDSHGRLLPLSRRLVEPGDLAETWKVFVQDAMGFQESLPTHHFTDGQVFDFGHLKLTAVHTPGHTQDHYCFFNARQGLLLSFDIDLTAYGPWYGNRESDLGAFRTSLERLRGLQPQIIASSHREIVSGERVLSELDRYEQIFHLRDIKILALLIEKPRRLTDLLAVSPFYGAYPYAADLLRYWEGRMIQKHLEKLISQGQVREKDELFNPV